MPVAIKRIYDEADPANGTRILVDRLWPRGLSKQKAGFDLWMKDVAPSSALRKWFNHQPERWPEFQARYREELQGNPALEDLRERAEAGTVTLLYGARNREFNHAAVLADVLKEGT
ncbi:MULTISPECIES: DUF488 domain-containing protein [unclassified Shinella]|uniref:DUF488 domain-containing protein n=1 Tax=unclassified Shinella TaxID=2643062 RepID=UPI00225CAECD|nr:MULTISPECIES: DUF488 domain-containing protein [unclassified Shinella]MCO5137365.1 DUF488 domain-containing protein [Shinella sp.]MDC7257459.1 DUF488 domain-containing protein [Shinella sp. YE25]CAI0340357.1 DUF488 domain-containing protein YeaO [Rhizobiaceae bacterium]CAK7258727.1 DUF488 domain-containing protein YeaO [Shinella sp. WSC3-e]